MPQQASDAYLLAGQVTERQRLQLQSLVWEPAGRRLLDEFDAPQRARALDLGCGCLGWLRVLSEWVGSSGEVVGTDVDRALLDDARAFCEEQNLRNVSVVVDDLFASQLPADFDLVHARFQIAPLGRANDIIDAMERLVRPGGLLILEDPTSASWQFHPAGPASEELVRLIIDGFARSGGNFDAGISNVAMLRQRGYDPVVRSTVLALAPDDPYLLLPLQFARGLRARLLEAVTAEELDALLARAEEELTNVAAWGHTFTLVQAAARVPLPEDCDRSTR